MKKLIKQLLSKLYIYKLFIKSVYNSITFFRTINKLHINRVVSYIILCAISILSLGCSNEQKETGSLSLKILLAASKNIDISMKDISFPVYNIQLNGPENQVENLNADETGIITIDGLVTGLWSVTVKAISTDKVYTGTQKAEVEIFKHRVVAHEITVEISESSVDSSDSIKIVSITKNTIGIQWGLRDYNDTSIVYDIYISQNSTMNTPEEIKANGQLVKTLANLTGSYSTYTISGLSESTSYYINVLVTDADLNSTAYNMIYTTTYSSSLVSMRISITQRDITWYFDKEYQCGQFANGDWWVVGPVTILAISPGSVNSDGRIMNGSMINPVANGNNGFDSSMGTYSSNLNIAYGVSSDNPLVVKRGSSLISTISLETTTNFTVMKSAEILTVLSEDPADGSFRPPYVGDDKTIRYNRNQLNYSLLKTLKPVDSTPLLSTVERYFERPWIDFYSRSFAGQYMHPSDNMPAYGRDIARQTNDGALMLHLNFSNSEKETLLISYVQLGIDLYEVTKDGNGYRAGWPADGGHGEGRKWPIMFAGLMLGDYDIQAIFTRTGDYAYTGNPVTSDLKSPLPDDYIHFQEDDDTFYVTSYDVIRSNSASWEPDERAETESYDYNHIGMPEWGIRHSYLPYRDNQHWDAMYRGANGITWQGFMLAALMMDVKDLWNHDAFFDYEDRYMAITNGDPDPFGYEVSGELATGRSLTAFAEEMWDAYRSDY